MVDPHLRPSKLSNSALLFLVLVPPIIISYLLFILNPGNADNIVMYRIQLAADAISIITLSGLWLTLLLDLLTPVHQKKLRPLEAHERGQLPTVDILLPVANEPLEVVAQTIQAALGVTYPHRVLVLDDGKSDKLKVLAGQLGALYYRRDLRRNAKSGNLNFGLQQSGADFFAVLDADFIAKPSFLTELMRYMDDEKVAFVQSPQDYSNLDNFIAGGTATAQEIFYRYVLPSRNSSNSAFCVGTNVLFRRSAINEIGGIFELDHSEDIWTSLALHERGWKSLYVNQVLASGLAPDSIPSYFKQQKRWAQGGFSILIKKNPLLIHGLSIDQRIQYLYSALFYFMGFSILAYLTMPIAYLLFGVSPIRVATAGEWLIRYVPYFTIVYAMPLFLTGKLSLGAVSTSLSTFYPYLQAFFSTILNRRHVWVTTSSQKRSQQPSILIYIWPHMLIIGFSLAGALTGWIGARDPDSTLINSFWALVNAGLLGAFIWHGAISVAEDTVPVPSPSLDLEKTYGI